jgi:hypothetical protein
MAVTNGGGVFSSFELEDVADEDEDEDGVEEGCSVM